MKKKEFVAELNDLGKRSEKFIFVIDYEFRKPLVFKLDEAEKKGVYFDIKGTTNWKYSKNIDHDFQLNLKPISRTKYFESFDLVIRHILHGDSYLTNLTFPTQIERNPSLDAIFNVAKAPYKLLYKDQFTLFSPECFISINNGKIRSYPMKGTIDASVENAEMKIMTDKKEIYEHNTIVDLIRNDLSQVAENVRVTKFRYIDRIVSHERELLQVSSEIEGDLDSDWPSVTGYILSRLLPAGSISGAPKKKTMEIIKNAEKQKRGYYTGIFGIFDGKNLDCAVNIRYVEKIGSKYYFRSGGGITALSNPDSEYLEMINKVNVPLG